MKIFLNILLIEENPGDDRIMGELLKEVKLFEYEFVHKKILQLQDF